MNAPSPRPAESAPEPALAAGLGPTAEVPRPLPRTGAVSGVLETIAFLRDPLFAGKRFAQYGNVFQTTLLGQPMVFVRGGAAITDLLAQPEATSGWWPESVRQLLGSRSLANRSGADHRARRRVVGQLFSAAALRRYSPAIVALVEELAAELRQAEAPIALVDRLRRFAFRVIATVVLGLEGEEREVLFLDFEIWTRALFSLPVALPGTPFARALQARQRLLARLSQVLERSRQRAAAGEPLAGGLDLLAGGVDEVGLPLDDDDLVEQLLLLLFAGYETTASSLSCLMAAILQDPELQRWLAPELERLPWPPPAGQATQTYDPEVAPRLAATISEVMRLNPPVGGFFRRTQRDLVLDGVQVPAGLVVQVALAASNRYRSKAGGEGAPTASVVRGSGVGGSGAESGREQARSPARDPASQPLREPGGEPRSQDPAPQSHGQESRSPDPAGPSRSQEPHRPSRSPDPGGPSRCDQSGSHESRSHEPAGQSRRDQSGSQEDLDCFRPQRHLEGESGLTLLPFGGGERVCLGKALAELEIRLLAVGLLRSVRLELIPDQDLSPQLLPSPSPRSGLLVRLAP